MRLIPQASYAQALHDHGVGLGTDKAVSAAILAAIDLLLGEADHVPSGKDREPESVNHKADTQSALGDLARLYARQDSGTTSMAILGEDFKDSRDQERAADFVAAINRGTLHPTLVLFERGLPHHAPADPDVTVIRESNLTTTHGDFGLGLSRKQRSKVVGGYLALLAAGGDQRDVNRFLLFFGENHDDIFKGFEYAIRHSRARYLERTERTFFFVRSYG